MQFICSKESFLRILNVAESVISTKNSISILSNVLIEAVNNKLKISACETKLSFIAEIGADISEEGSISIHCNKLYSITRKLPGDEIFISVDQNKQIIIKPKNNESINYTLKGIDAEKFPPIKTIEDIDFFSLKQDVLMEMTKKTIFSISQSESRRFVSGIYFEKSDDSIKMVATDGKRLSFIKKNVKISSKLDKGIIIPPKILTETLKLCTENGDVQIALTEKNIYMKIDNFYFISNLLEGNFPPYEKVIPTDQNKSMKLKRDLLFESLDRIAQISDKESHKITLSIVKNKMTIFTEDITIGSGEETIPVEYSDEEFKIFLNYTFITDVLNVLKSDNVIFEFKDQQSTVTVKEEKDDDYIYVMMPMSS